MPEKRGVDRDPEDYRPAKGVVANVQASVPTGETPEGAATRMVMEMVKGQGPSTQLAEHLGRCWAAFVRSARSE